MKHINKFDDFKVNESFDFDISQLPNNIIQALFSDYGKSMITIGLIAGYSKIKDIFSFFKTPKFNKIKPIFDKIKDDAVINELLVELYPHRHAATFDSSDVSCERRKSLEILDKIFKRSEELLSKKDYDMFYSLVRKYDYQRNYQGNYFTQQKPIESAKAKTDKIIISLHQKGKLTPEEIAETTGVTTDYVNNLISKM